MNLITLARSGLPLLLVPLATQVYGAPAMQGAAAVRTGAGTGTITALDPRGGTVTIAHGPIPAIGWPAMTMTFRASPPALLKNLRAGQRVSFAVKARGMNAEVTAIRPR